MAPSNEMKKRESILPYLTTNPLQVPQRIRIDNRIESAESHRSLERRRSS